MSARSSEILMISASAVLLVYGMLTLRQPHAFSVTLVGIALLVSSGRYEKQVGITVVGLTTAFLAIIATSFPAMGKDFQDFLVILLWVGVALLVLGRWLFKRY